MKFLKSTVAIVALLALGSMDAKQVNKKATTAAEAPVSSRIEETSATPERTAETPTQGKSRHYNAIRQTIMTEYGNMMKASDRLMDRMRDLPIGMHIADKQELLEKAKFYCDMVMNSMSKNIDKLDKEITKLNNHNYAERP